MSTTIYYLQLLPEQPIVSSARPQPEQAKLVECEANAWEVNQFFYRYIGRHWQWFDKQHWSDIQWQHYVADPNLRTWMLLYQGTPAGYFELLKHHDGSVEIMYFGLAKAFIDKKLGGWLLTQALQMARQWTQERIWVHTCNLDHPAALANYQARGMQLYQTEVSAD